MPRKNKIEAALSPFQLAAFLKEMTEMPSPTLQKIADLVHGKFGLEVSLMGAKTFRDGTFDSYLKRLENASQLSQAIASASSNNPGSSLADAASALLSQKVFEQISQIDELGEISTKGLAYILQTLRSENRKAETVKLAQEKWNADLLQRMNKFSDELKEIIKDGELTDIQKINAARKRLFGILPEDVGAPEGNRAQ